MTKSELLKALERFTDETEVIIFDGEAYFDGVLVDQGRIGFPDCDECDVREQHIPPMDIGDWLCICDRKCEGGRTVIAICAG